MIHKMSIEEAMRKLHPREYQEAVLFKQAFQLSDLCTAFRKAWKIPARGFNGQKQYARWYAELIKQTNKYLKSEKYKTNQRQVKQKRKEVYERKVSDTDLKMFALHKWLNVPLNKYEYDVGTMTLNSGEPVYWRDFVEQCLLFKDFLIYPIIRPVPVPRARWDNSAQTYEVFIENIFPDTTTKDFDSREFTRKLKELQKKLPGYRQQKSRLRRRFTFGLQVLDLDATRSDLDDFQKAEKIEGEVGSLGFGAVENKRVKKVKQTRYRLKKYLSQFGRVKQRS